MLQDHERYMRMALEEADRAGAAGNRAVGAIIVRQGTVVGRGANSRTSAKDPTGHAEVTAIHDAVRSMGGLDFSGCALYTTLEPCPMCAGAIVVNGIATVVIGGMHTPEERRWGDYSVERLLGMVGQGNHIQTGVLADECTLMLHEWDVKQGLA